MGRAPCCDKANVKKGPWSPEEDAKLKSYIEKHGTGGNWIALPQKIGLKRCGKSCRLRWLNYLRPNIKHGGFSEEEDKIILSLYVSIGSRWSIIAAQLPGRTDNDIKNYWNTRLKKKLLGKQRKDQQHARKGNTLIKQEDNRLVDPSSLNSNIFNNTQIPYWSYLPTPNASSLPNYSNQAALGPALNDHTSIRKLLMKVGGNFDSPVNHYNNAYPNIIPQIDTLHQPLNDGLSVSSLPMDSIINTAALPSTSQMTNPSHYNTAEVGVGMSILDGEGATFPPELEELMSSNPRRGDGLDFLLYGDHYGNNLVNHGGPTSETMTCGEGSGWGEMGSLGSIPHLDSDCLGFEEGIHEGECQFQRNLRYPSQL